MAHLFKQMYVDEVNFENMSYEHMIELVFTEFVHEQMKELEASGKDTTDGTLFDIYKEYLATSEEAYRWSKYAEKAISLLDLELVWCTIVETCKVLQYPKPSPYYRNYFESLDHMPTDVLCRMHSEIERTPFIMNLIDYVMCVYKLFVLSRQA